MRFRTTPALAFAGGSGIKGTLILACVGRMLGEAACETVGAVERWRSAEIQIALCRSRIQYRIEICLVGH